MDGLDVLLVSGDQFKPAQVAALGHRIACIQIFGMYHHIKAIPEGDFFPIRVSDPAGSPYLARSAPGPVVLHTSANAIRDAVVYANMIELC